MFCLLILKNAFLTVVTISLIIVSMYLLRDLFTILN